MINKLAIGTAQFGMPYGISNRNGQVQEEAITEILDLAWNNDIDTLDTAKAYGTSEESIGNFLKNQPRNSWNVITKLSDGKENITNQIRDSIQKLTLCPSVILAHSTELFLDKDFQRKLTKAKQNSIIKKMGVSIYNESEINQVLNSAYKPDVIQIPMNILDTRLYRSGILTSLYEKNIEVHIRSVFLQGLFYLDDNVINDRFNDAKSAIVRLKSIAKDAKLTLAELSLLWVVSLVEITKVVIGVENVSHLKNHLNTLNKDASKAAFQEALKIHYENKVLLNPLSWL